MISTNGISNVQSYYGTSVLKQSRSAASEKTNSANAGSSVKSAEGKLSDKAQKYLESLRKQYGEYDLAVADDMDDKKASIRQGSKEFSVIFSSDELEKMADDATYADEKLNQIDDAVKMAKRISEQFEETRAQGNDNQDVGINKIAISLEDDGTVSLFAELEKSADRQKEIQEKANEKRAEEKKEQTQKSSEKKTENAYNKKNDSVKRTIVKAKSEDELLDKIGKIDWSKIQSEGVKTGERFDMSI